MRKLFRPVVEERKRIIIGRPAAVESLSEGEELRRVGEAAEHILFPAPHDLVGIEHFAPAVIGMIVGKHHIVDLGAGGIDPLHIPGDPFSGVPACIRKHRDGLLAPADGIVVPAIEEHRRPVREDHEHRLGDAGIDEMNLELAFLPAAPGITDRFVGSTACKCIFPVDEQSGSRQGRGLDEISSVHIVMIILSGKSFSSSSGTGVRRPAGRGPCGAAGRTSAGRRCTARVPGSGGRSWSGNRRCTR